MQQVGQWLGCGEQVARRRRDWIEHLAQIGRARCETREMIFEIFEISGEPDIFCANRLIHTE